MTHPDPPSPHTSVTLGLIQTHAFPDPDQNLDHHTHLIRQAASKGAQIIATQELFRTHYFCQEEDHTNFSLAEPIPDGPTTRTLSQLAKQLHIVIIASLFERRAPGLYHNTAIILDADGSYLGSYRKMHIPDDPRYYEKFYFTPGDLGYRAWRTAYATIGVLICWDQWYPEAARLTALQGAQILFYPTAIGWHPDEKATCGAAQLQAWQTIQRSHAIANGCYLAAINRLGHETPYGPPGIEFWGHSFIADPMGQIIAEAPSDQETILIASLDLSLIDTTRTHWPFLRDRRIDSYADLQRRYLDNP
ncbi:MAG: carbon-nitrogen hydrolase [Verrucomicrobiae bacterium]|nr:carbon-nitrogen hydrolase [Verrucomicrobiae bacterium]